MKALPVRGRGAHGNPANRFDGIDVDREAWTAEDPGPETRLLRDRSRSIIARNDSPDVGFEASVNPYRGCEHGCVYCLDGETPILMADGVARPLAELRTGDRVCGTRREGRRRRLVRTEIRAHWSTRRPAFRLLLTDGTQLVASADHRFLTEGGWKRVAEGEEGRRGPTLTPGDRLAGWGAAGAPAPTSDRSVDFRDELAVVRIVGLRGDRELFDLTTGTGDFIAAGVVSHNCYARPTHEYLGFSAGLDFESRILVKEDAPRLLRAELSSPRWTPKVVAMSGVTDPYQPAERRLRVTRGCLEVLAEARNPVIVVTKSRLVARDADLLGELASHRAARVMVSITSLDEDLRRVLEPRAPAPPRRLDAIERLAAAGVPVGVLVAPVIPGLTEHELPSILEAAARAGARSAGWVMLRLPHGVKELFEAWLDTHFPDRKKKILGRVREMRGGRLNDPRFRSRMRGEGPLANQVASMFRVAALRAGLDGPGEPLSVAAFRRPRPPEPRPDAGDPMAPQMSLFPPGAPMSG